MSMATGGMAASSRTGSNVNNYTPAFNVGKSKGGYRPSQLQQFSPEQMKLFESMFGHLGPNSFLSRLAGGDQSMFQQLEAPALQQFAGLQGNIASRFSNMGMGARRSSGFQNTMNQASSDFSQQLQAQRMGLQRQALGDLMGFSNQLLNQRPYENQLLKQEQGFLKNLLSGGVNAFMGALPGAFTGNPFAAVGGAMSGMKAGSGASGGGMDFMGPSQGWTRNFNDVWGQDFR